MDQIPGRRHCLCPHQPQRPEEMLLAILTHLSSKGLSLQQDRTHYLHSDPSTLPSLCTCTQRVERPQLREYNPPLSNSPQALKESQVSKLRSREVGGKALRSRCVPCPVRPQAIDVALTCTKRCLLGHNAGPRTETQVEFKVATVHSTRDPAPIKSVRPGKDGGTWSPSSGVSPPLGRIIRNALLSPPNCPVNSGELL